MVTTKFKKKEYLLVLNIEGKPMAVIACKAGKVNITSKVELVIKEDLTCDNVKILNDKVIEYDNVSVLAEYFEDGERYESKFFLQFVALY